MDRLNKVLGHLSVESKNLHTNQTSANSDDDIVIVSALRTAIGRARKGKFKDTHPVDLLAAALKGVIKDAGIDPKLVDDVIVGNVLAPGGFAVNARVASFLAGLPSSTAVSTCNRQCSSGLQAFANVAANIRSGFYEIGIGAGVESMSLTPMGPAAIGSLSDTMFTHQEAQDCLIPMGMTSENVAERYGVSRVQQDAMAVESHRRALYAQKQGFFNSEIIPVTTKFTTKEGKETEITVTKDDGPREGSTPARLAKLRAVFKKGGTTTAGNSSQVSDGAAAVLLMTRRKARELGLKVMGKFVSFAVKGVKPDVMGIGPAVAIPAALKKAGMSIPDVDVWEINEAFASQATYCVRHLGIDMAKVNPNGGAIALGHPLGCTGARQIATLFNELKRTGKKTGVVSMCIGTGMGAAAVFQAE